MLLIDVNEQIINKVETFVRKKLGQDFSKELKEGERPEHLRFDMSGNRDSDDGELENEKIWELFNDQLYWDLCVRKSYNDDRRANADFVFTFHKGNGYLYRVGSDGEWQDNEIESYGGYGTVSILTDLILRFAHSTNIKDLD